jgi:hypothetical protein
MQQRPGARTELVYSYRGIVGEDGALSLLEIADARRDDDEKI